MVDSNPSDAEIVITQAKLFDTSRQAVIGTTLDGAIVYWNETAEQLYGWTADEVLGRSAVDVTPASTSIETAEAIMEQLRQGRGWFGFFDVRGKDGGEFRVSVRDLPVRNSAGQLVGIVGISEPIGETG